MARVAQYTENVSFLDSKVQKERIEAISSDCEVSAGAVWRRAVEIGIEQAEREFRASAAFAAEKDTFHEGNRRRAGVVTQ